MEKPSLTPLPHLGILRIHGPDTLKFLQGQITNDIVKAPVLQWLHAAHCTPKGRMVANFDAIKTDDQSVFLRLPADAQDKLQTALGKYIVFSKAQLQDCSGDYRLLGLVGESAASWLQQQMGIEFDEDTNTVIDNKALYLKLDDQRIECWLPNTQDVPESWSQLQPADSAIWQLRDIELGRGWVQQDTCEEFLPQLLNLQTPAINGINFKKGCYTGQEIVARMHYKGKLKRHMYRFSVNSSEPGAQEIVPGADLYIGDAAQSVGNVVNAVVTGDLTHFLAVLTGEVAENEIEKLHLTTMAPGKLIRKPLPYSVDDA